MLLRKGKGRGPIKMAIFAFLAVFVLGLGYQLQHVLFAPSHENSIESGSSTSGSVSGVGRGLGSDAATTQAGLASLESKLRSEIEDWTAAQEVRAWVSAHWKIRLG